MLQPHIEQKFGGLGKRITIKSDGTRCRVEAGGKWIEFNLPAVKQIMVSPKRGLFTPKDQRVIHVLGSGGPIVEITTRCKPADAQAAATFIRYLIRDAKGRG